MKRVAWLLCTAALSGACGSPAASLEATFDDELVEARARTVDMAVVDGGDCDQLLSVPHDELSSVTSILLSRQSAYPIDPDGNLLEGLPTGRALAFDVAVYDETPMLIARNCQVAEISASEPTSIVMPMLALPSCSRTPSDLDLVIVLDLSSETVLANAALGGELIPRMRAFVEAGFSAGTTLSLVTHGPNPPTQVVAPTSVLAEVGTALDSLEGAYGGVGTPYQALTLATSLQRSRAVCGRRPAILVIAAAPDTGELGALDEALIGIAASRSEPNDDIFTAAIGITLEGNQAMVDLLDETLGTRLGGLSVDAYTASLNNSRLRFQSLIDLNN